MWKNAIQMGILNLVTLTLANVLFLLNALTAFMEILIQLSVRRNVQVLYYLETTIQDFARELVPMEPSSRMIPKSVCILVQLRTQTVILNMEILLTSTTIASVNVLMTLLPIIK